ncbi:hypothetical protein [Rhodoplanes roseus]|uniref:Uncharacterized protein n=1 Tax=Rhodoplanes roseus TaxID=29409 RepID=A0A327KI18_9BRAD|nr:hypothetical protein [Rhodoplanes roseus]RAI37796.1 hypothetical protein CH341_29020 [Rhodoplanes roseus]
MSDFRIKDFLDRLGSLGLLFSATRMADGSIRLNQWRGINYYDNEDEIRTIWSEAMTGHESRAQDIARYVELTQSRARPLKAA